MMFLARTINLDRVQRIVKRLLKGVDLRYVYGRYSALALGFGSILINTKTPLIWFVL